eukprot:EG_transcript_22897
MPVDGGPPKELLFPLLVQSAGFFFSFIFLIHCPPLHPSSFPGIWTKGEVGTWAFAAWPCLPLQCTSSRFSQRFLSALSVLSLPSPAIAATPQCIGADPNPRRQPGHCGFVTDREVFALQSLCAA